MIAVVNRLALKLAVGIACLLLLALLVHDRNRWKAKTAHYAELLAGERAAHAGTRVNYRAAAEQARRADAANAARVRADQAAINERTAHDYQSRIAAARVAAQRLRRDARAAGADPSSGGAAPVPGLSAAAQGAAQAAGENRLPRAEHRRQAEVAPLDADDALIATEQAIQLDELIKWVSRQANVENSRD